jgi:hypothetical protein
MLIVAGAYHFWPKRVAFRNDYCLSCQAPRRSIAVRTFDVGHLYWIPILPVGFWRHWKCNVCNRDPHVNPKTRRSFLWAGLLCLVAVSVAFWDPSVADLGAGVWIPRIGAPAAAIALFIYLLRAPRATSLRERLAAIPPAADAVCPFCSTPLLSGTGARWSCPGCGAERY